MTEQRMWLWRRIGLTYGAGLGAVAIFVLLEACYGDLSGMGGIAIFVPAVLGAVAAPLWLDLRQGISTRDTVDRIAVGLGAGVGAVYLVAMLAEAGVVSRRADAPVLAAILLFPLNLAVCSGFRRRHRFALLVEVVVTVLGGLGWFLILRRAVLVSSIVTIGPLSVPRALDFPRWVPYMLLESAWGYLLTPLALPFVGFAALRVGRRWGGLAGAFAGELLIGVVLLAWAYRLAGLLALIVLLLHRLVVRSPGPRRWAYALVVGLCILPVDVSLQRGGTHGFRFLPARGGDYIGDAVRNPPAYGFVLVGEGFYYSPRLVWVW